MHKVIFLNVLFLISSLSFSQDINYAREILKTITSKEFHGRGYEFNGDKIAANYISNELKKLGVKSFEKDYNQQFKISVNTFPGEISVSIDTNNLSAGTDYLVSPNSGSCSGIFKLKYLHEEGIELLNSKNSDIFIVVDTSKICNEKLKKAAKEIVKFNLFKARGYIHIIEGNLMYQESQKRNKHTIIEVRKNAFLENSKEISVNIFSKFEKKYKTQNVVGYIEGEVDSFIVFSGHYDHLGHMGKNIFFPGANDNGSGVAMLLNLAKHYSSLKEKPHYSIAFMFFSAEEVGILGSSHYTENPLFPLSKIKFMFNLDMIGTGEDGCTVVNGSVLKKEFDLLTKINSEKNYLKEIKARGEAANSDHFFFYENGVKAVFIYTRGGTSFYHDIRDKEETLMLSEFEDLFNLLTEFVKQYE